MRTPSCMIGGVAAGARPRQSRLARLVPGAALALTLASAQAFAQAPQDQAYREITAKELYEGIMDGALASWVQDPAQRTALSTFMSTSYVLGVADSAKGVKWCPPANLGVRAMPETVLDYLADLPEARLSESAADVVAEALGKAHPCGR